MHNHLAIFTTASMTVAGLSIGGCAGDARVPVPDVYDITPPTTLNDPVCVTGDPGPAQRYAAEQAAARRTAEAGYMGTFTAPGDATDTTQ